MKSKKILFYLVSLIAILSAYIFIRNRDYFVRYERQKAAEKEQKERQVFEENNIVPELFSLASDYTAPSEFISIFNNSLILSLKYKTFNALSTNTSSFPEEGSFRIGMSESDTRDNLGVIGRKSTSTVEKELARDALNSTKNTYTFTKSTVYYSSIDITNYTLRKNSDSYFVLLTNITVDSIKYRDDFGDVASRQGAKEYLLNSKNNPNLERIGDFSITPISEIANRLITQQKKSKAKFYSTNCFLGYKIKNGIPEVTSGANGLPYVGSSRPERIDFQMTVFITGGVDEIQDFKFSKLDFVDFDKQKKDQFKKETPEEIAKAAQVKAGLFPLGADPIVANPSGDTRFVVVKVTLISVGQADISAQVEANIDRLRDAVSTFLADQRIDDMLKRSFRSQMAAQLALAFNRILGPGTVKEIIFPQFVIQ